ncbi:transketolase family protein [Seleniivibrio woodruffii]|uniref:Transketolase n=1 Tax=Seleniivibrio woodruffii TaxID=1078050 RepID=A0A4R1KEG1_9BACT|nr:transketolase C-terminal domain-containing protein [Seleniivibrio woodruffii]TCK61659.1 transketolase [Seleniivibrio woodruffii]TVZ35226.1 transketolase subunit B [Seleniivibrio woodruffii]
MRNRIAKRIYEKAKEDKSLFLISGDAGLGVWEQYQKDFSDRFLNPGVNEACDVGMAAGLALCGHKVIYYNIAPFVVMRPYEQLRNDVCYQELPVIFVGTGSGITYAPAGMTHYVVEDIALCRTLPNLNIFSPCDPIEADAAFAYAYESRNPSYIRIPKNGEPEVHKAPIKDITQPHVLNEGSDVLLIFHGSISDDVLKACEELKDKGISACAVSHPCVSKISEEMLDMISMFPAVFCIEEHFEYGGLGTMLADSCNSFSVHKKIHKLGIKNQYIHTVGNRDFLRKHYGIDAGSIVSAVTGVLHG